MGLHRIDARDGRLGPEVSSRCRAGGRRLAAGCSASRDREARAALQQRLQGAPPQDLGPRADLLWKSARRFYRDREFAYVWLDGSAPDARAEALQKAVGATVVDGLDPADYDFKPLEPLQARARSRIPLEKGAVSPAQRAEAEVRFTASFLKLSSELLVGRVDPARGPATGSASTAWWRGADAGAWRRPAACKPP
jgi:murein L,D-transpeptidase YcbB/YkuD